MTPERLEAIKRWNTGELSGVLDYVDELVGSHRMRSGPELELMWDAIIRGDGFDREGNTYDMTPTDLPRLVYTYAKALREQNRRLVEAVITAESRRGKAEDRVTKYLALEQRVAALEILLDAPAGDES